MRRLFIYIILSLFTLEIFGYSSSFLNIEPTGYKLFINTEWNDSENAYADRDSLVGV